MTIGRRNRLLSRRRSRPISMRGMRRSRPMSIRRSKMRSRRRKMKERMYKFFDEKAAPYAYVLL